VIESLVFGQEWDDDVRVVLAVRLATARRSTRRSSPQIKPRDPHRLHAAPRARRDRGRATTCRAPDRASSPSWPSPTP
jgi:hypothetical protein